jgi:Flp pilus assembly protein TadG
MLLPLIRRPERNAKPRSKERGFTMALVAMAMVTIISMAALSIDIGTLYEAKAEAQRAADAAALTAARVVSISGATGSNGTGWAQICGGAASTATQAAISMAQQNLIGGVAAASGSVSVQYGAGSAGATNANCSGIANFAVNPVVTVSVQRTNLPVFFARIFSLFGSRYSGTTVSATATAEAFNPSGSSPMVPVNPRCVKPWFVPNKDPEHGSVTFVDATSGQLTTQGVSTTGVIGETFNLSPDCMINRRGRCHLINPGTNPGPTATDATPPTAGTLQYVPGEVPAASVAIAANPSITACSQIQNADYWNAVAGCDQTTVYACGQSFANTVNLANNPGLPDNDSANAVQCLINESATGLGNGQDYLAPGPSTGPYTYPFQTLSGGNSALISTGVAGGSQITNTPSIVSLPIYDSAARPAINPIGTTTVTVVGFLQVFINSADNTTSPTTGGNINVTVMNVSGCGNSATGTAVNGTSPVPIRLITPP